MAIGRPNHFLDIEQLNIAKDYWQGRLRLNHWNIEVHIEPEKVMGQNTGTNDYNTEHLESIISILDPNDHNETGGYDMEFILVHELLHLHIEVYRHSDTYDDRQHLDMEQAINSIARTLMDLEHERMNPS